MRLAGGGGVALTFQQRRFLSDAPDAVSLKNWATLRLDPGDNSFTAGFRFEARLPDGGMLRTGRVTACGTRVVAEPA